MHNNTINSESALYLKKLISPINSSGGRNNHGRITSHSRGGGHKRMYRKLSYLSNNPAIVERFEYDPNRSASLMIIKYTDDSSCDRFSYVLATRGIKIGHKFDFYSGYSSGMSLEIGSVPVGSKIHSIENKPGAGAVFARSSGSCAKIVRKDNKGVIISLPSGRRCIVSTSAMCVLGVPCDYNRCINGDISRDNMSSKIGKAGRNRWLGNRPSVRGVAMNPVDHPHGGGEGKTSGGRHPVSPWGYCTKGKKTVNKKKDVL